MTCQENYTRDVGRLKRDIRKTLNDRKVLRRELSVLSVQLVCVTLNDGAVDSSPGLKDSALVEEHMQGQGSRTRGPGPVRVDR
jgi:hypothetical protein